MAQNPDYNPIDKKYDELFNDIHSNSDSLGSAESKDSQTIPSIRAKRKSLKSNNARTSDETSNTSGANTSLATQEGARPEGFNYSPGGSKDYDSEDEGDNSNIDYSSFKSMRSSFKNKINSSGKKKAAAIVIGSLGGVVGIIMLFFMLFMLLSGFGLKQAAEVMKQWHAYRNVRYALKGVTRVVAADSRLKRDKAKGLHAIPESSFTDKLRGLNMNKILNNLEQTDSINYDKLVSDGKIRVGGHEIDVPSGRRGRAQFIRNLQLAIHDVDPVRSDSRIYNQKITDAIFQRVGLHKVRWTEKQLSKLKKDGAKERAKQAQIDSADQVRGSPAAESVGDEEWDRMIKELSEDVDENIKDGAKEPVGNGQGKLAASISNFRKNLAGRLAGYLNGIIVSTLYTACSFRAIKKIIDEGDKLADSQSVRQFGALQSASDQVNEGTTNAEAVGSTLELLGDFHDQSLYQKDIHNANWQSGAYRKLPAIDRPVLKGTQLVSTLETLGNLSGYLTTDKMCDFMASGAGQVTVTLGSVAFQAMTLGSWKTFSELGEAAAKAGTEELMEKAASEATEKATSGVFKKLMENIGKEFAQQALGAATGYLTGNAISQLKGLDPSLRHILAVAGGAATGNLAGGQRNMKKLALSVGIGAASASAAALGMLYVKTKLTTRYVGATYNGTGDGQFFNLADAGGDVLNNDTSRTQFYGKPLSSGQVSVELNQQYADYVNTQSKKGFFARIFSLSDPYSLMSRVAVSLPRSFSQLGTKAFAGLSSSFSILGQFSISSPKLATTIGSIISNPSAVYAASTPDPDAAHSGVIQFGYSNDELQTMDNNDDYSMFNIGKWADDHQDFIQQTDLKYGECFEPGVAFYELPGKCKNASNFTGTEMLKWRIYHMDDITLDDFKNLETVTGGSSQSTGASNPVSGDTKGLAQQILDSPNIGLPGRLVKEDLEDTAQGKPGSSGAPVSAQLLQIVLALAQDNKVTITAIESGGTGHSAGSKHYTGHAIDIDQINGQEAYDVIDQYWDVITPSAKGATLLQGDCPGAEQPPASSGIIRNNGDTCNHLHISVP